MTPHKQPTKAQRRKLVGLLAAYILKDGAHIRIQQAAYSKWMAELERLEGLFPHIDFRGETSMGSLTRAAQVKAKQKVIRGAGSTH